MWLPESLQKLFEAFKKLPGVGPRTSERLSFFLLKEPVILNELIEALVEARNNLKFCSICHGITDEDPCPICKDPKRETGLLCVVERPQDVFLIEKTGAFHGKYHVLGGLISPVDGIEPQDLFIDDLKVRVKKENIKEVIIALSPTVEGDVTASYIQDLLKNTGVKITRIARGLPAGSDLGLTDFTTLRDAILNRTEF